MNLRGIMNQVTARGAGRPTGGRPMGGPMGGAPGAGRPAGGGMESTGARVGGMVGRFLNGRRGGRRF